MEIVAQPYDQYRLGDFLLEGLESDALAFSGASAFARSSGISYLAPAIYAFSESRAFQLTVGIDLQGTSKEALELLLASAGRKARLFVFHNPSAAFHPKTFRFEYVDQWKVYSGSGNLTRGGMFENYEAGFVIALLKGEKSDKAVNKRLTAEFARWSDMRSGVVRALTPDLIRELADRKLLLTETAISVARAAAKSSAGVPKKKTPLFTAEGVPSAPALPKAAQTKSAERNETVTRRSQTPSRRTSTAVAVNSVPKTFVMTVRKTDVGVGQTTPGTQKRAAEIFIPLPSVWEQPTFWGWPDLFEPDPEWEGPVKHGYGKMDRRQMPFYLGSQAEWVTMTFNPNKGDFRLRNSTLRDAGQIDDILRISLAGTPKTPVYLAEFIRVGTPEHAAELARCMTPVKKPSTKLYGYY